MMINTSNYEKGNYILADKNKDFLRFTHFLGLYLINCHKTSILAENLETTHVNQRHLSNHCWYK